MRAAGAHRAILVAVLLLSPALTTACGRQDREGAAGDRAALQKALSAVAAPKGLTSTKGVSPACGLDLDCPEIGSSVTYEPVRGNLKACTAAVVLHDSLPVQTGRWGGAKSAPFPGAQALPEVMAAVATLRPGAAGMRAACVTALEADWTRAGDTGETFVMLSDLLPKAVPVKSAEAVLTVENRHLVESPDDVVITLTYTGPDSFAEASRPHTP
ncbi:MAG TPA: hypothetical protein VN712_03735 [Dermatophilaceae bacterium]|nr:hypothetical protein [Dermatophilaceae bacterium]